MKIKKDNLKKVIVIESIIFVAFFISSIIVAAISNGQECSNLGPFLLYFKILCKMGVLEILLLLITIILFFDLLYKIIKYNGWIR